MEGHKDAQKGEHQEEKNSMFCVGNDKDGDIEKRCTGMAINDYREEVGQSDMLVGGYLQEWEEL